MVRIKGKALALAAVIGLLANGAAMAGTQDISGVYDLTTVAKGADGKPVCVESWTLKSDGGFLIESGQEQVRGHWRLTGDAKDGWMIARTDQTTNGLPDCIGHRTTKPMVDIVVDFYFNVDSDLVLANAPARNSDGSLLYKPDAFLTKAHKP